MKTTQSSNLCHNGNNNGVNTFKMMVRAELGLRTIGPCDWSQSSYADKFNESYNLILQGDLAVVFVVVHSSLKIGGRCVVGAAELCPEMYCGRRWIHWQAAGGIICLREIWLDGDLEDHAVCLQVGGLHFLS